MEWYYVGEDEQQTGPISDGDLKQLWDSGVVNGETYVWAEHLADWQTIDECAELKSSLTPPAAAEPAPEPVPASVPAVPDLPAAPAIPMMMMAPQMGSNTNSDPLAALKKRRKKKREKKEMEQAALQEEETEDPSSQGSPTSPTVSRNALREAEAAKWRTLTTPEGTSYFHNQETNETTWDKPDCLKTAEEIDKDGEWFWMPHKIEAFKPARLVCKNTNGSWTVETEDGSSHTVNKRHIPLEPLQWSQLRHPVQDLVLLDVMNRPLILNNLRERYVDNEIYTNVGSILIALNPYKRLPLYSPSIIESYQKNKTRQPPHVYSIADDAFQGMVSSLQNQAIVISGESGAGKTVCTKQCMQYLAEVAGSSETNIEQKILSANPILEAFGNAKTVRNNNSSRFGKYVMIFFDKKWKISGASTTNYLLEKSRVVIHSEEERNYHVFFQLLRGAPADLLKKLHLNGDPSSYNNLKHGTPDVDDVDDKADFEELTKSMEKLQFSEQQYNDVFTIVAGVLHLGNVEFNSTGDRQCAVKAGDAIKHVAEHFGLDTKELNKAITTRVFKSRGSEDIDIPLGKDQAKSVKDALGKFIYEKLFDWLVQKVNLSTKPSGDKAKKEISIGILDIFGFEIFKTNSFEQLCINFANEKLQQFFNFWTFKKEEKVYETEQIDFKKVKFIDNQGVLDLIEKKREGILGMIDEEIRIPKGSDTTFMKKLESKHVKTKEFKRVLRRPDNFIVVHYAGNVEYSSHSFLEKSKDRMTDDLYNLITGTKFGFLKTLFEGDTAASSKTLGTKFKKQLNDLMRTLNSTEPHYIRCIKPNPRKAPLQFVGQMVLLQLQYSGVFEAVEIRKKGFPFRLPHVEFYKHYRCILPKKKDWPADNKEKCRIIEKKLGMEGKLKMGRTMVLYRAKEHRIMSLTRNLAVEKVVIYLQAIYRGYLARKLRIKLLKLRPILQDALKGRDIPKIEAALSKCDGVGFPMLEIGKLKRLKYVIEEEKRVQEKLRVLLTKDPEDVFDELEAQIASAEDIKFMNNLVEEGRKKLDEIKVRRKTRSWLDQGIKEHLRDKLTWAVESFEKLKMEKPADKKLYQDARDELVRLDKEEKIIEELDSSLKTGGFVEPNDTIDYKTAAAAVSKAESFVMLTEAGIASLKRCTYFRDLREAMSSAEGTKDKAAWNKVEECLQSDSEYNEEPEVRTAIGELAKQRSESDVDEKLQEAYKKYDQDTLAYQLQQAKNFNMFGNALYPIVEKAQERLDRIIEARSKLDEARKRVEQSLLEVAVADSESFGYETSEVVEARKLRDAVGQLNLEAAQVREILDEPYMRDVVARAEKVRLMTDDIKYLEGICALSEEKLGQAQLRAATKIKDTGRKNLVTIKLATLVRKRAPGMFKIKNFSRLRKPQGWASLKFLCLDRKKLEAGMMKFEKNKIHASLTNLEKHHEKDARTIFKTIQAFMGDRRFDSTPEHLAGDILNKVLEENNQPLMDEVYMQLIKQLTNNPSTTSTRKGWSLIRICLECFPPQESENYMTEWLEKHAKPSKDFIDIMQRTLFEGMRRRALSEREIQDVIDGKSLGNNENFKTPRAFKKPVYTAPSWESVMQKQEGQSGGGGGGGGGGYDAKANGGGFYADEKQQQVKEGEELSGGATAEEEAYRREPVQTNEDYEENPPLPPVPPPPPQNSEAADWGTAEHEGQTYYYNKVTGETTWDKPACLME